MKKTMIFQTLEQTKKDGDTFSYPKSSEYQLTAPWKLLSSTAIDQDTQVPKIGLNLKGKPGQFGISEHLLCVKILGGDLGQKHSQLFWGLPCLHSESIVATVLVPLSSYSLEPHIVLFNGVCKAASNTALNHDYPALPRPHTLPLTFVHPQPLPNIQPQPQALPFTQVHPQAHMQFPPSPMQSLSLTCGSPSQIPQNRTASEVLNENEHLQCHLLQNHQDRWCGLVPERQQYETAFGFLVPHFPLVSQPSQNYISIPRASHFHFSKLQDNLQPYEANNPIPPRSCQPYSKARELEVIAPRFKLTGPSPYSCKCAKPPRSVHWAQSCSDLSSGELGHSESFCDRVSTKSQLRNDVAKNLGQILGRCPLDNPQMIPECYVLNTMRAVPETEKKWVCHSNTGSDNERLSISRKSLDQSQTRSTLRLHMSRKLWQITTGQIPIKVCCSWLAENVPLWNSVLGSIYCNTAIPKIPFLDHKTQKMLETHLIRFQMSQKWGLPLKVIESIKFYMLREARTWPLSQFDIPTSNSISGMDLKSNFPHLFRGSSGLVHGDKVETASSSSITDHLPLSISHADKEEEGSLRQSPSNTSDEVTEKVQTIEGDRPSNVDTLSQNDELQSRPSQESLIKEQVPGSESKNEAASSPSHLEMGITEGKQRLEENPKHALTPSTLSEILRAQEESAILPESGSSSKLGSSPEKNEDRNKTASILATEHSPSRMSVPQDPAMSDFKKQLFKELKFKLETQPQSQTEGYESDVSYTSDSLTGYSPSSSNSVSSADVSVFRDIYAHLHNTGIRFDSWQESKFFKCILRNLTPVDKRLALPAPRKENRAETLGLESSKAGKKSQPANGKPDKSHPPKSYFRRKIGQFFQWLYSSKDSTSHRSEKDNALFMSCGPPEAHELMASLGKLLEDKLLCGKKSELLEWSHKKSLQAQPKPTQGQHSNPGAIFAQYGEKSYCCCPHTAISPGPSRRQNPGHSHVSFEQQPEFWGYSPFPESRDP